jgi:hypothetical protein
VSVGKTLIAMQQREDPFLNNFNWNSATKDQLAPGYLISLLVRQTSCSSCLVNEALRWSDTLNKYDRKTVQLIVFTDSPSSKRIMETFRSADQRYLVCPLPDFEQRLAELHVKQTPLLLFSQFSSRRIIYSHLPGLMESTNDDFQRKVEVFLSCN